MPYIGASNISTSSFINLKEKHSISNRGSSSSNTSSNNSLLSPRQRSSNNNNNNNENSPLSDFSVSGLNSPLREPIGNHDTTVSSSTSELDKSEMDDQMNSLSLVPTNSTNMDVDSRELFNIPNESTHAYTYNPLSPNSLAVRLTILKRTLEIIIGNPAMLADPDENNLLAMNIHSTTNSIMNSTQISRRNSLAMRKKKNNNIMSRTQSLSNNNLYNKPFEDGQNTLTRSISVSTEKSRNSTTNNSNSNNNIVTAPSAALNAFVSNTRVSNDQGTTENQTFINPHQMDPVKISTIHRTNSLAFLPTNWNDYNSAPNKISHGTSKKALSTTTSGLNLRFRHPFANSGATISNISEALQCNDQEDNVPYVNTEVDESAQLINAQRSNLMGLLDLLNETLENNTSSKASDLHMLSLLNINKLILNKDEKKMDTPGYKSEYTSTNDLNEQEETKTQSLEQHHHHSNAERRTLALKKTLLDSLAEPFFERNAVEEKLIEDEEETQQEIDQFINANVSMSDIRPQQDYGRILRPFTSTKNMAPQAIFTCTLNHPWPFKAANDLACLLFGISKNALRALTLLDLIHSDSRPFVLHKILSTEGQELVFAGEIIGIIQPGSNSSNLIWASFWAKRKNGLLVCVFERVPCDYVDVILNLQDFTVDNIVKKCGILGENDFGNLIDNSPVRTATPSPTATPTPTTSSTHPKFELGVSNNDGGQEDEENERPSSLRSSNSSEIHDKKKTVKFANDIRELDEISHSLKQLIDNVRDGTLSSVDDDLLPLPIRIINHINKRRYFTLNHLSSNIPCAISASILENEMKLKIHSLPYEAGLFIVDSQTLQLISFNKSISKNMFGIHFADLVGRPITDIIPSFNDITAYIRSNYPHLDFKSPKNRGLVLTEHFFRKVQAEMINDPESFYTSVGFDALHRDGCTIKVDFQLRVLNSAIILVWITHSRDVVLPDYTTTPSQLQMLKENDLSVFGSGTSSSTSSKKSSTKYSVESLKDMGKSTSSLSINEKNRVRIQEATTPQSEVVSMVDTPLAPNNDIVETTDNDIIVQDPETKHKLELARIYTRDKSEFVKGNFKVDEDLIKSKISLHPSESNEESSTDELNDTEGPSSNISVSSLALDDNREDQPHTSFLVTPAKKIGAEKHTKKFSDFVILQKMGEGAYGKVNLCIHKKEKYIVCIKMIFKERILVDTWVRDRKLGTIPSEIQIMATLNKKPHENILRLLDFFEDDNYYYIETPIHGETGCIDLFDLIEFKTNMTEFEAKLIFKQVVSGIKHLHHQGIVHRDIKDENVIVDSKGLVKIIDFGSAAYVKSGPFDVFVGTIDYAAPEVLSGEPYEGKPQDIWALGILLYTIVFKENPFYNIDEILEGDLKFDSNTEVTEDCMELIKKVLIRQVRNRPAIDEIFDDKWLDV
ncbi:serine/threonine protein kinase PSK1 NDAI_0H02470 [Naumovozyma dairenensis CBS 421]|uniref:non-specific serine/threonine protein kinase n=1 Tax=Naumovozyma dairenensis (strain ATCC 10597 / BCRC 20456 / CBS 421 / NBRC 0211 / NRRL Y-12639) TaxID=1071378 RepID=G0WF60_NAUDC|nr:hypothetical protein NDAI_0H02470 [Naumovozyma dairenensis CBS 421]CCD26421.1 hypothetical protein NDAI_0H02470 [Naumovozyma dairenensis CBS 421]